MAAKILEGITAQWMSCVFLLTALTEQGPRVAAAQLELVSPHLQDGDDTPGFLSSITARSRRLSASMTALVEADHEIYAINARWTHLRAEKAQNISWLGEAIVALRRSVQAHFKEPDMVALGLHSPRERRSEPLFLQAHLIETAFQRPDLARLLGERRYKSVLDLEAPVGYMADATTALRTTLDDLYKIQRRYDQAVAEKNERMKAHGQVFIYTARSFEADCVLAGEKELARKVRPSVSRPGQTEEKPEGEAVAPVPRPGQDPALVLAAVTEPHGPVSEAAGSTTG